MIKRFVYHFARVVFEVARRVDDLAVHMGDDLPRCEVCRAEEATIKGAVAWVCAGCSTWADFSGPEEDR